MSMSICQSTAVFYLVKNESQFRFLLSVKRIYFHFWLNLFNNRHSVDQVPGGFEEFLHEISILGVRQSVVTPLGLDLAIDNDGTIGRENIFDQFGSDIESLFTSLNTIGSNFVDGGSVLGSEGHSGSLVNGSSGQVLILLRGTIIKLR